MKDKIICKEILFYFISIKILNLYIEYLMCATIYLSIKDH